MSPDVTCILISGLESHSLYLRCACGCEPFKVNAVIDVEVRVPSHPSQSLALQVVWNSDQLPKRGDFVEGRVALGSVSHQRVMTFAVGSECIILYTPYMQLDFVQRALIKLLKLNNHGETRHESNPRQRTAN